MINDQNKQTTEQELKPQYFHSIQGLTGIKSIQMLENVTKEALLTIYH